MTREEVIKIGKDSCKATSEELKIYHNIDCDLSSLSDDYYFELGNKIIEGNKFIFSESNEDKFIIDKNLGFEENLYLYLKRKYERDSEWI